MAPETEILGGRRGPQSVNTGQFGLGHIMIIVKRPGVAGAVLQSPLKLIDYFID